MANFGRALAAALTALCIVAVPLPWGGAGTALADDLDDLFLQILVNPTDVDLNLRYARLAEERGVLRKALATYERILIQDPDNPDASDGYYRIRRALEPAFTDIKVTLGGRYETNARQQSTGAGGGEDFTGRAQIDLRDERNLMGRRWRTESSVLGDLHADISDLDFFRAEVITGPLLNLSSKIRLHTGVGGSYANLDGSDLYSEAAVKLGIEGILSGALQRLDVRLAYREIGERYSNADGLVLDVIGRLAKPDVIAQNDIFVFYPRFRYSDPMGVAPSPATPDQLYPAHYFEYGASAAYYFPLTDTVLFGVTFNGYYRDYEQAIQGGGGEREDVFIAPGAQLVFKDVLGPRTAIRLEYRYEQNFSNDSLEDFINHVIGIRASRSF